MKYIHGTIYRGAFDEDGGVAYDVPVDIETEQDLLVNLIWEMGRLHKWAMYIDEDPCKEYNTALMDAKNLIWDKLDQYATPTTN